MLSDEEKKAIEDVIEMIELHKDGCLITTEDDFDNLEILLNIIEKQQKELEQEKEKNKGLEIRANELNGLAEIVEKDYIHKGKIKAKIEEIENEIEQLRTEKNVTFDSRIYKITIQKEVLQSLLNEEE